MAGGTGKLRSTVTGGTEVKVDSGWWDGEYKVDSGWWDGS